MILSRNSLISVLKQAMPGVETGNTILEGSDTFVFTNGFVYTYNDNISVASKLTDDAKELSGTIKANDFYILLSRFKDDELKIIVKEDRWIIKSGSARAELTLLADSAIEYVKRILPENPTWKALPVRFFDGMKMALFASNNSSLSGIYIHNDILTSTDEMRINCYKLDASIEDTVWLADTAVKELLKLNNLEQMNVSQGWVHFLAKDGTIFSCKRLQHEKYPYDKVMDLITKNKKEDRDVCGILPKELVEVVNRASALSMNMESFDAIKLIFNNDGIEVYSERASGNYEETVKWEKKIEKEFEPVSIYIDSGMIESGVKQSKSFYLKQRQLKNGVSKKIVFENDFGVQLVETLEEK